MPIEFPCTNCTRQVRVPDGSEGKKCKCPECQTVLKVPEIEVEAIEIKLEVPCPRCDFFLVCDPSLEGTRGLCPNCKFIFTITPPGSTQTLEPEATLQMTFAFQCPHCQQLFEGKPGMEGRKGKCIHCKEVFEIKKYVDPSSLVVTKKTAAANPSADDKLPSAIDFSAPANATPIKATPIKAQSVMTTPIKAQLAKATPVKVQPVANTTRSSEPPVENDDWLNSVPSPVSNTYSQPLNPYASTPSTASYAAQSAMSATGDPVSVRNYHLAHESAIKGFGLLYAIGAGMYFLLAALAIVLAIVMFTIGKMAISLGIALLVCTMIILTVGGLAALVSSGLYKLSDVGKIGGIIFGILSLGALPVGTAMGVYMLTLVFSEKGKMVFSPSYREIVRQTPHIRAYIPIFVWIILGLGALSILLVGVLFVFALLGAR